MRFSCRQRWSWRRQTTLVRDEQIEGAHRLIESAALHINFSEESTRSTINDIVVPNRRAPSSRSAATACKTALAAMTDAVPDDDDHNDPDFDFSQTAPSQLLHSLNEMVSSTPTASASPPSSADEREHLMQQRSLIKAIKAAAELRKIYSTKSGHHQTDAKPTSMGTVHSGENGV